MRTASRWWPPVTAAGLLALALVVPFGVEAQQGPDKELHDAVGAIINQGADLFNQPPFDRSGCARLYEGALLGLKPALKGRPELLKAAEDGLTQSRGLMDPSERAFALRRALGQVYDGLAPDGGKPAPKKDGAGAKDVKPEPKKDATAPKTKDFPPDLPTGGKDQPTKDFPSDLPKDTAPPVKDKGTAPKVEPKKDAPKVEPKKDAPKVTPADAPKVEPKKDAPKKDTAQAAPKAGADVTGRVVLDGKPLAQAIVTFLGAKGNAVAATAGADGAYKLPGIAPGEYKVGVSAAAAKGQVAVEQLSPRYTNPETSGLVLNARAGANNFDIELRAQKADKAGQKN